MLPASLWMGAVWQRFGNCAAFVICAVISFAEVGLLHLNAMPSREGKSL